VTTTASPEGDAAGGARRWTEADRAPFRFAGRWWTRGPLGEVLLFDDAARDWRMPPPAQTPFFMRRPKFTSLRTPAVVLYILFGLFVAVTLVALTADVDRALLLRDIADGKRVTFDQEQASYDFFGIVKGLQLMIVLPIAGVFIWWTRRATCNAASLGVRDAEFTPGWSIAWWFIPFANWVQPCRVLLQAWRASDPALPADLSDRYRRRSTSLWIIIWWIAYVVANGLWTGAWTAAADDSGELTAGELADVTWFAFGMDIAMIVVTALAIVVVARLTSRQERANQKFDLPAGLPAVPGAETSSASPYDAIPGTAAAGW